jgi:predicted TIM-barrel fold metal-dependent hydrolase
VRDCPARVVIDHLGLPGLPDGNDAAVPLDDDAVERLAHLDHVWVKVSAPYRSAPGAADRTLRRLARTAGTQRMVWGSDWPWTRHEQGRDFAQLLAWPAEVLGTATAESLRGANASRLLDPA